jgi:hypothetical protein
MRKDSPLEILLWRVLNDRRIFSYRNACDCIVARSEMATFRNWLGSGNLQEALRFVEKKTETLPLDKRCEHARQFAQRLKAGLPQYPAHLIRVCSRLGVYEIKVGFEFGAWFFL